MEGNNGSLLHGTYDEAAAAADFQAAVQQFRNGGQENHISSSAVDQENQISEADKLKEVTNLFRSFSNNCFYWSTHPVLRDLCIFRQSESLAPEEVTSSRKETDR